MQVVQVVGSVVGRFVVSEISCFTVIQLRSRHPCSISSLFRQSTRFSQRVYRNATMKVDDDCGYN
jgi:hypothetical protein